jgi:hypothetical protein
MNTIEPTAGGHVTLRGHRIAVDSDIGAAFTTDCVRFVEGLVNEEALRKKYQLDDAAWQLLEANEPLQRAVGAEKEKRIRNGTAAQEKVAHLFVEAPGILGTIMNDTAASARHRIEACRELRQVALPAAEAAAGTNQTFTTTLNFG